MNALVITSHGLAMLFEHGKLLLHGGRIITHVAGIGVLRHQLERHLLAITPDQQRDMWFLDALGLINCTTHPIIVALEVRLLLGPHRHFSAILCSFLLYVDFMLLYGTTEVDENTWQL